MANVQGLMESATSGKAKGMTKANLFYSLLMVVIAAGAEGQKKK
jgi:hypothetical protein